MIRNTSSSELKLDDQGDLVPNEYHQKFELNNLQPNNVNTNNNEIYKNKYTTFEKISTDQRQITNPFKFYSTSDIGNTSSIPTNECLDIPNSCNDFSKKSSWLSSKCFDNDLCRYHGPAQGKELTKKIVKKFRNKSALNNLSRMSGCGIITLMHATDKSTGDTRSNFIKSKINSCSSKRVRQETPMFRTEDQEHAFRQIEDVHNYSKLNRYGYCESESNKAININTCSSNSSNQEEDDDGDEEDEEREDKGFDIVNYDQLVKVRKLSGTAQQSGKPVAPVIRTQQNKNQDLISPNALRIENEGNITPPDHHARRPMNAFLIFCKRHRGIVKDKYKSHENRSITKILGEWWASLDANDKKCYVNLAKQNKDAFFSANPNFKWYKLPAPSLRTLNTRPGTIERGEYQSEVADVSKPQHLNYHTVPTHDVPRRIEKKNVSYFKLADEKQMGGLNNLMSPNSTAPSKNEALQKALSETSSFFNSSFNRKHNTAEEDCSNIKRSYSDGSGSGSEGDLTPKKSARSCKGKKYQEFINCGKINAVPPKQLISTKIRQPSKILNNSESGEYFDMQMDKTSTAETTSQNQLLFPKQDGQSKTDNRQWVVTHYEDSYCFDKQQFGFVSFDLEDKIRRLPAQCLETYLLRKKSTKRKKKINSKNRSSPQQSKLQEGFLKETTQQSVYQPKIPLEAKEQIIGSQKRKARKESITRRDITSVQNDVQVLVGSSHVASASVVCRKSPTNQLLPKVNQNSTPDLLILAEVAANCTA